MARSDPSSATKPTSGATGPIEHEVTFLGHAGFAISTESATILLDPWLSAGGAFGGAWHQNPCNHWLLDHFLTSATAIRAVVVSHRHGDHADVETLAKLVSVGYTVYTPDFRRNGLARTLARAGIRPTVVEDGVEQELGDCLVRVIAAESDEVSDAAIIVDVAGDRLIDLNDCTSFDVVSEATDALPKPHHTIVTGQTAPSNWYPVCYDFPLAESRQIVRRRSIEKSVAILRAAVRMHASVFLPSGGPALSVPMASDSREPLLLTPDDLRSTIADASSQISFPGEIRWPQVGHYLSGEPDTTIKFEATACTRDELVRRERLLAEAGTISAATAFESLLAHSHARVHPELRNPVFVGVSGLPDNMIRIGPGAEVAVVTPPTGDDAWTVWFSRSDVSRLHRGEFEWADMTVSHRASVRRGEGQFDPVGYAVLAGEEAYESGYGSSAAARFAVHTVATPTGRYLVQQYCPHEAADLRDGWIETSPTGHSCLICPRHGWRFDLDDGGRCDRADVALRIDRIDGVLPT